MAGQNETLLGITGMKNILKAINQCWASLYAHRSVQYRHQNGQALVTSMGVVIQKMVPSDAAGVLFTADPLTGNPGVYTITASWGLGEAVVNGSIEPDTIVVDVTKKDHKSYEIKEGTKGEKIVMAPNGGINIVPLEPGQEGCCLSQKQIQELVSIGNKLTSLLGHPQDIEFGIFIDEVFILQSRPITTIHRLSDWELEHEYDSAQPTDEEICTKANLGEVLPGALSPLTRSTLLKILDSAMQVNAGKKTDQRHVSLETCAWITTIQHHALLNIMDGVLKMPQKTLSVTSKAVDYAVFGHEVTTQDWLDKAVLRHGVRSELRSNIIMLNDLLIQGSVHNKYRKKYSSMKLFSELDSLSSSEILLAIEKSFHDLASIGYLHTKNSECSSIYQMIVFLIFVGEEQVWSPQLLQDMARILTVDKAAVDVESAGVPLGLMSLSNAITSTEGWREEFALADSSTAKLWLQEKLGPEMKDFLSKFGHRCLKEFELLSHPWEEDMSPVVFTLQAMLKVEKSGFKSTGTFEPAQRQVMTGSRLKDLLLGWLILLAHHSVSRREESKSLLIRAVHQIRIAYRALATSLVQQNLIPSQDIITFLSHYELRQLILENQTDLIPKALRRQKLFPKLEHLNFPEIVIGCQMEESTATTPTGEGLVSGTPACPGQVSGPARVITHLEDAGTIQPGEILITTGTDIGWSPYFPMLSGVVTELGGLISHGAVVAREYGLPCLVGARGATSLFKTGDHVRIDTEMGIIYKIYS